MPAITWWLVITWPSPSITTAEPRLPLTCASAKPAGANGRPTRLATAGAVAMTASA
jgi:hypothetical protein